MRRSGKEPSGWWGALDVTARRRRRNSIPRTRLPPLHWHALVDAPSPAAQRTAARVTAGTKLPHLAAVGGAARRRAIQGSRCRLLRQAVALHVGKIFWKGDIRQVGANVWVEKELPVEVEGVHRALSGRRSSAARESGDENNDFLDHCVGVLS